jgi:hypothetical protein
MKIGTKSVLFGAHCFFLHPWFVAYAWWKLYGFPFDPRLWVAFFVHDLGYIGKPNMDGEEGEMHPYKGALIMNRLFDKLKVKKIFPDGNIHYTKKGVNGILSDIYHGKINNRNENYWFLFTLYHSRFLAKRNDAQYSQLCVADKLAIAITPAWLYLPMVRWTGEIKEYMKDAAINSSGVIKVQDNQKKWYLAVQDYVRKWVYEHKDLKEDLWTPSSRKSVNKEGVWQ